MSPDQGTGAHTGGLTESQTFNSGVVYLRYLRTR